MDDQVLKIIIVVALFVLMGYGVYVFLLPFWKESDKKEKAVNYGVKGFLYILAVITSVGSCIFGEKISLNSVVLIFISAIEIISCFKMRQSLLESSAAHNKKYNKGIWLWVTIPVTICVIVLIPYFITIFMEILKADLSWIGFWGGYLGAILGGLITLFVLWKTLKEEKNARNREEKVSYFNNMIHLWSELACLTNDLCLFIYRCEADYKKEEKNINDSIEKVYIQKAKVASFKTEIELLLRTRMELYKIDELLTSLNIIFEKVENTIALFESEKQKKFSDVKGHNNLEKNINELKIEVKKSTEKIRNLVIQNTF